MRSCFLIPFLVEALVVGHANAEDENVCVALARIIGSNHQTTLDKEQQDSVNKVNMCSESYSTASESRKAHIAASYELYTGEGSASDDEIASNQSTLCEGHFGEYWQSTLKTADEQTVSRGWCGGNI